MCASVKASFLSIRHQRRGFNLVEAAIVLGVIGLVIGGIWVAASKITNDLKLNQATTGLLLIVDQYRSIYKPFGITAIYNGPSTITSQIIGVIPEGFSRRNDGTLVDPWGRGMGNIQTYRQDDLIDLANLGFWFYNVSRANCIELISRLNRARYIYTVNSTSGATYNMPLSISSANSLVCQAATQNVNFAFHLFK